MILTFIRHGATNGNLEKRYIGKTDESLCESGILQIKKNLAQKKYPRADIIFSSPMKRCLETCSLIYPNRPPIIIEEFKEMNFGSFEGKNYDELKSNPEYQKWLESKGKIPFPNGEGREDFITRTVKGFQKMIEIVRHCEQSEAISTKEGENYQKMLQKIIHLNNDFKYDKEKLRISAVVHGGTIMAIMSELTKKDYYDFQVANGEIGTYEF